MNTFFYKQLAHPVVLASIGATALIVAASGWYYLSNTRAPSASFTQASSTPAFVNASGTVEPAQNPNLSFQSGGRVARISIAVGSSVEKGRILASLDTSILSAQLLGAEASLKTQQAKLAALEAPPRDVDLSAKRTALAQAEQSLAFAYQSAPTAVNTAYDNAFSGMSADTDSMFTQPNSAIDPGLAFQTRDSTSANNAAQKRLAANAELALWERADATIGSASQAQLDQAIVDALGHLTVLRSYADSLLVALSSALPVNSFTAATIAADQAAVGAYRDTINGQIATLQALQKTLTTDALSVQSAKDALNQALSGATQQDLDAQEAQVEAAAANVANIQAQIGQAQIAAPYAGTVGSVQVKVGDTVAPGAVAVTLNPASALQVVAYVSESDAGRIKTGANADVTLDAYGSGRHFAATVAEVDRSPTMQSGVPAYKITLQFNQNDPAVSSGMTANVSVAL